MCGNKKLKYKYVRDQEEPKQIKKATPEEVF
jgi:hypothetical protein